MAAALSEEQASLLANIQNCPELFAVNTPTYSDRVFKDECTLSFDTPFSPAGIYVCLSNYEGQFRAYGERFVKQSGEGKKAPDGIYLRVKKTRIPRKATPVDETPAGQKAPTKLGIGVDGGFKSDEQKWDERVEHSICHSRFAGSLPFPSDGLPDAIRKSVDAILSHTDAGIEEAAQWEEPPPKVSKYAENLVQEDNGKKISPDPKDWKCEESGMTENLWLNLSDGYIGSGRRNWDGSGGTGAALTHYEDRKGSGKEYPLCVKLGTITPEGADVFSYAADESDMVTDPDLAKHLAHWGINIMQMEKTEKSMAELQIELNLNHNWGAILEDGEALVNCFAPGRVGLKNLGNSCYMNSVIQTLMSVPDFRAAFLGPEKMDAALKRCADAKVSPSDDINVQFCKLASGLLTDYYIEESEAVRSQAEVPEGEDPETFRKKLQSEEIFVAPMMLKSLLGKGHSEFSSSRQQDANEFLQHIFSRFETYRGETGKKEDDLSRMFSFEVEDRLQMTSGEHAGKVSYQTQAANVLSFGIPLDAVDNQALVDEEQEKKRQKTESGAKAESAATLPNVPFSAVVDHFAAVSTVDIRNAQASKTMRVARFPKFLWVQFQRYILDSSWQQKKLEHTVFVPESIDLSMLKGNGLVPGEQELPDSSQQGTGAAGASVDPVVADATIVAQIVSMGFSDNAAKRAALATQNSGAETAINWVMTHMADADLNDPLPDPSAAQGAQPSGEGGDPALIAQICSMGFTQEQAAFSLKKNNNNGDVAVMWLFENAGAVEGLIAAEEVAAANASAGGGEDEKLPSCSGKYKLRGFISHVGKNTGSGHYVCHIKSEETGKWVIYNDRKVSWSNRTPFQHGYLYLFEAVDE
eukprot:g7264.t1